MENGIIIHRLFTKPILIQTGQLHRKLKGVLKDQIRHLNSLGVPAHLRTLGLLVKDEVGNEKSGVVAKTRTRVPNQAQIVILNRIHLDQ